jgi:hypothetical protein
MLVLSRDDSPNFHIGWVNSGLTQQNYKELAELYNKHKENGEWLYASFEWMCVDVPCQILFALIFFPTLGKYLGHYMDGQIGWSTSRELIIRLLVVVISGLEILAFPTNQFGGQEPGSNEQIKDFACTRFKAEYPIFSKVQTKLTCSPLTNE